MAFQYRAPANTATSAIRLAMNNRTPSSTTGGNSSSSNPRTPSSTPPRSTIGAAALGLGGSRLLGLIAGGAGTGLDAVGRLMMGGGYRPGNPDIQLQQPQQQKDDYGFNAGTQYDDAIRKQAENLRRSKENAIRGIETEISNLDPEYMKRQSQADTESIIAGQRLREQLAAEGQSGGENVTAMAQLQAARQNVMGGIGEEKAQRIQQLKNRILDIQNAPDEGAVQLQLEKIKALQDEARAKQAQDNWTQTFERGVFESDRNYEAAQAARAAEQTQNKILSLWKTAEEIGYIPPELAQLIGVKPGTQTLAAKQQAQDALNAAEQIKIAWKNLAVNQMRAETDRMNASTARIRASQSGASSADKTQQKNTVASKVETYYKNQLPGYFETPQGYYKYIIGQDAADRIIKDIGATEYRKLVDWARKYI